MIDNSPSVQRTMPTSVWVKKQIVTKVEATSQKDQDKVIHDIYETTVYDYNGKKQAVTKSSTIDYLV